MGVRCLSRRMQVMSGCAVVGLSLAAGVAEGAPAAGWSMETTPAALAVVGPTSSVSCADPMHCWIAGAAIRNGSSSAPAIAATADGGVTWRMQRVPPAVGSLESIACTSTTHCLAVSEDTLGGQAKAVSTNDGGRTWKLRRLPPAANSSVLALACVGNRCWAPFDGSRGPLGATTVTTGIAVTNDLGATWSVQALPPNVVGAGPIGCASARRCVEDAFTYQGRQTLLITTTDGGRHWRTRWTNSSGIGFGGIACPTVRRCVAAGGVMTNPMTQRTRGVVLTTANGGASWQRAQVPSGVGTLAGVSCPTSADCWAVGAANTGRAPYYSVIVSHDGGRTWQLQSAPTFAAAPQFGAISCTSRLDCVAAGSGGLTADVLATASGGQ